MMPEVRADSFFVPATLAERQQWLVWRLEDNPGRKKPLKVPYYAGTGKRRVGTQGSKEDRAQLVDYATAEVAARSRKFTGVGFAFLPGDGLIGIDLDGCLNTEDEERRLRAQRILSACNSFAEYSPSGDGMHIFVQGESDTFKSNLLGVEVFCGRQFFTFTGRHIEGTPRDVNSIDADVLVRLRRTVKDKPRELDKTVQMPSAPPSADKIIEALSYISPDVGYDDWLRVGMAIQAGVGEAGISIWDSWSQRSEKYPGAAEIGSHWRSFKPGRGITEATLFRMAVDAGWKAKPPLRLQPVSPPSFECDEDGVILNMPSPSNDNAETIEELGELTGWLMRHASLKVIGRDADDGIWLVKPGHREPTHYPMQKLLRKAELIALMPKKKLDELVLFSGQGERFTAESAASALLVAADENPVFERIAPTAAVISEDDLSGNQGRDSAILARSMQDRLIFDVYSQSWYRWSTIWRRINEEFVRKAIVMAVDQALGSEFENSYINGTTSLLRTRLCRITEAEAEAGEDPWEDDRTKLPMRNGVLDLDSRELQPHSPDFMFNWLMPHDYDPLAKCPTIENFINRLSGGDVSTEAVLYAFLAAVLHGRYDLERYLEFVGMAGTGKSTYITLCRELVGAENVHSTDMKTLHNNNFETANIYGKRLVMISDADKYGGDIGTFKNLTGRDVIRREEKQKQAQGGFVYKGMVIVAANNPIQFADTSTAMARRRVPVHIDKKLDKSEVDYQLGSKLREEIPGLINKLLGMSQQEIASVLSDSEGHRRRASMRALVDTNAIAAWANECLVKDRRASTPVGKLGAEHSVFMYPNYARFCEQTGRRGIVSLNTFTRSLHDVMATAGVDIEVKRKNTGTHVIGVRLRYENSTDDDMPHLLLE